MTWRSYSPRLCSARLRQRTRQLSSVKLKDHINPPGLCITTVARRAVGGEGRISAQMGLPESLYCTYGCMYVYMHAVMVLAEGSGYTHEGVAVENSNIDSSLASTLLGIESCWQLSRHWLLR